MAKKKKSGHSQKALTESSVDSARPGSPWWSKPAVHMLTLLLLGLLAYGHTLSAPFHWDELPLIEHNEIVHDLNYFLHPSLTQGHPFRDAYVNRYVTYLTFALNNRLHGLSVGGYHIVNITLHLLNAALVWFLINALLRTPFLRETPLAAARHYAAWVVSALFVSHPMATEAVTYIFQRHATLAAFFSLLGFVLYIEARLRGSLALLIACVLSIALGMKSKENVFMFPLVIAAFEFLFMRTQSLPMPNQSASPEKPRLIWLIPVLLTMLIIPLTLATNTKPGEGIATGLTDRGADYLNVTSDQKHLEYAATQPRVVATYLRMLLLPYGQNLDHDYPPSTSFTEPVVLLAIALHMILIGLAGFLIHRSRRGPAELRIAGFGILWFYMMLAVESSVIPIPMIINEYRTYLPGVGFYLALLSMLAAALYHRSILPARGRQVMAALASLVLVLAMLAHVRNSAWLTPLSLWGDAAQKNPDSTRVLKHLGLAYDNAGEFDKAIATYQRSLEVDPADHEAIYDIGVVMAKLGQRDQAKNMYIRALELRPANASARNNLGALYNEEGRSDLAEEQFALAVEIDPRHYTARANLAVLLLNRQEWAAAMKHLEVLSRVWPTDAEIHNKLGITYMKQGMLQQAKKEFEQAVALRPGHAYAYYNLALIALENKDIASVVRHMRRASELDPSNASFRQGLQYFEQQLAQ